MDNGILSEGIGKAEALYGTVWIKTNLTNVLYVPDLDVNLFSMSTLLDNGYKMHSDKDKCELLEKEGKKCAVTTT